MSVLQRLYDSEINASIGSFWDMGFIAMLGDAMNGVTEQRTCASYAEAEAFLDEAARRHYPESAYARLPPSGPAGRN